jgi:hypothetical protein
MKVNTEISGNYSLGAVSSKRQAARHEREIKDTAGEKYSGFNGKEKIKQENISDEEKSFFAKMYPLNQNEIMDYHYYQRTGKPSGLVLGSLFDKKG